MVYLQKSQPAPGCLAAELVKANGDHNCGDVLPRLRDDFKNKCYICEDKNPTTINTEHFKAHRGNNAMKCDWDNLFYSCGHCNNTKETNIAFDDILNCTVQADNVETDIAYRLDPFPKEDVEIAPIGAGVRLTNTVNFLRAVYNGTTVLKSIEANNLRKKILSDIREFQDLLFAYFDDTNTPAETTAIESKIERHLRDSSSFTAFKRWIIRDRPNLMAVFSKYL